MDNNRPHNFAIKYGEVVHALSFSNFDWECNLLAIGSQKSVTVGNCAFKGNEASTDGVTFKELASFLVTSRVTDISWSPETSLVILPNIVKLAAALANNNICVFTSNLKEETDTLHLTGHTACVNSVAYDTDKGEYCASASDDQTCRVWSLSGDTVCCFHLGSPGMTVRWHTDEPTKLLVGLKNGIIIIYSLQSQKPIMSLDCNSSPLLSIDWSGHDCVMVAAVTTENCFIFNISQTSQPVQCIKNTGGGYRQVKWCQCRNNVIATTGRNGQPFKVLSMPHGQVILAGSLKISNGISWHRQLPILAVGGDKAIYFWHIPKT